MTSSGVLSRSRLVAAEWRKTCPAGSPCALTPERLIRGLRDRRHPTAGQGLMQRRHHAQEHLLGIHDRAGMEDVILDRDTDILRQRQDRGAARLAADPNERVVPVDIVQPKIGDIAGTQGEPGEEQHDGAVAQSHGRRSVARCDDAFDIVARQMTGQCREPVSRNRRHRTDKPRPAKAVQHEEAQIQPKR